jgi:hypothetical protein
MDNLGLTKDSGGVMVPKALQFGTKSFGLKAVRSRGVWIPTSGAGPYSYSSNNIIRTNINVGGANSFLDTRTLRLVFSIKPTELGGISASSTGSPVDGLFFPTGQSIDDVAQVAAGTQLLGIYLNQNGAQSAFNRVRLLNLAAGGQPISDVPNYDVVSSVLSDLGSSNADFNNNELSGNAVSLHSEMASNMLITKKYYPLLQYKNSALAGTPQAATSYTPTTGLTGMATVAQILSQAVPSNFSIQLISPLNYINSYFPLGLMGGSNGSSLQLELYLNDPKSFMFSLFSQRNITNYEISNVRVECDVVQIQDDRFMTGIFKRMLQNDGVKLITQNFDVIQNSIAAGAEGFNWSFGYRCSSLKSLFCAWAKPSVDWNIYDSSPLSQGTRLYPNTNSFQIRLNNTVFYPQQQMQLTTLPMSALEITKEALNVDNPNIKYGEWLTQLKASTFANATDLLGHNTRVKSEAGTATLSTVIENALYELQYVNPSSKHVLAVSTEQLHNSGDASLVSGVEVAQVEIKQVMNSGGYKINPNALSTSYYVANQNTTAITAATAAAYNFYAIMMTDCVLQFKSSSDGSSATLYKLV